MVLRRTKKPTPPLLAMGSLSIIFLTSTVCLSLKLFYHQSDSSLPIYIPLLVIPACVVSF